jgi:hypothetical protein
LSSKKKRETISVWAVNQLWAHARDGFDDLLATADKLRKGDLRASGAHREALGKLKVRAANFLKDAGHQATEPTLRRVMQSLSAIAASGWEPDEPGALTADRQPPGFGVPGLAAGERVERDKPAPREDREAKRRAEAERQRMEAALRTAKGDVRAKQHEVSRLEKELEEAQRAAEAAQGIVDDLERELKSR